MTKPAKGKGRSATIAVLASALITTVASATLAYAQQDPEQLKQADTYSCLLQGRTNGWSSAPGSPYSFVGPADCALADHDGATDGNQDTKPISGEFELSGTHSGDQGACTIDFDSQPQGQGLLKLDLNGDGTQEQIAFEYRIRATAGQGALIPNPATPTDPFKAYGAFNLAATDTFENLGGTYVGCISGAPSNLFIDGALELQSTTDAHDQATAGTGQAANDADQAKQDTEQAAEQAKADADQAAGEAMQDVAAIQQQANDARAWAEQQVNGADDWAKTQANAAIDSAEGPVREYDESVPTAGIDPTHPIYYPIATAVQNHEQLKADKNAVLDWEGATRKDPAYSPVFGGLTMAANLLDDHQSRLHSDATGLGPWSQDVRDFVEENLGTSKAIDTYICHTFSTFAIHAPAAAQA